MTETFKATVAVFTILMMLHITPTSAHPPDPEMLHYLERVFEDAKSLNRPLVQGELNLLPRGKEGFANTVRCFFDTNTSMSDDFRILKFNLSSLSLSDKIASIQLVLKQSSSTTLSYVSQLYEIIGNSTKQIMLDSGEYSGQWHTLQVQNIEGSINADSLRRNYHLALSITTDDGESIGLQDILRTFKPMLLVYTNTLVDWLGKEVKLEIERMEAERMEVIRKQEKKEDEASLVGERSWQTKKERKRNADISVQTVTPRPLDGMRHLSCRKQSTSPIDLKLSETYAVTYPAQVNFSFCYGTCTSPLQVGQTDLYSNHAKLIALTAPHLARTRISPCCIPHEMTTIPVIYQSTTTQIFTMTSLSVVVSCRCM